MAERLRLIAGCPLFKGLSFESVESQLQESRYQVKKFSKGSMIAQAGDSCDYLHIVLHGSVRGEMTDPSGKLIKIEDIESPRPIALSFIYGYDHEFPVNVTANEDSEIFMIHRDHLTILLQKNKELLTNFLNLISSRAQFLSSKIRLLSFKTIKGKIAHYVLRLAGEELVSVTLPVSQKEIAEMFGVTRPALARALAEMNDEGLLKVMRREITIIDKEKLKQIIE